MDRKLSDHKTAEENARLCEEVLQKNILLENRVNELTNELKEAKAKLKEIDSIASMSHELRTPLNSIIGFIGILLQGMAGELNPEQKDMLGRSYDASRRLLSLISDIADISRLQAGQLDVFPEVFSIRSLIDEAVGEIKPEADRKGLSPEVIILKELTLSTDRKILLQCLRNYLNIALNFTERGKITVTAEEQNGSVKITVEDTGTGIKTEELPALLDSYDRPDSPLKQSTQCTGLRLYLTKKLACQILKGKVRLSSTPGKGSMFAIIIPQIL